MADNDPFASIIPLCHISSSQLDLSNSDSDRSDDGQSRRRDADDSQQPVSPSALAALLALRDRSDSEPSETTCCFPPVESTPICLESPPESPESGEKTVDLGRDSDLGLSEVVVTQKLAASSESGGGKVIGVSMSESEWQEFMAWKRSCKGKGPVFEEDVVLGSENVGLISGAGIANNGLASIDSTEDVVVLGSENEGLISGAGIAKNVVLGSEDEGLISGSGIAKNVALGSEDEGLISGSGIAKNVALGSEDEGLISGSGIAKDGRVSNDGVGDGSNEARAEDVQHHIEDTDKFRRDSDFRKKSKGTRVLPISMRGGAQEWDSGWPSESDSRKRSEATRDSDAPCGSGLRKRTKETRVLPVPTNAAANEGNSGANDRVIMNALQLLSGRRREPKFKTRDLLEIAKLRGVAFPRPRWWGEEEKDGN